MEEEKRIFKSSITGERLLLTLTELSIRLDGTPTKHVLAVWDKGERKDLC